MSTIRRRTILLAGGASAAATVLPASFSAHADDAILRVSSLGFDAADSTRFLQQALNSSARVVVIDRQASDWVTGPLFLKRDDLHLVLEPGVVVTAKEGAFPSTTSCLLTITGSRNVTIDGYGATLAMNKPEYTTGEWRMGLSALSVSDLTIRGLTIRDSGGDGLYLGNAKKSNLPTYCSNVTVQDVWLDNHRRNGVSIISVDGLLMDGVVVTNTNGTAPMAAIDVEPNQATERASNIVLRNVRTAGNERVSLQYGVGRPGVAAAAPMGVEIDNWRSDEPATCRSIIVSGPADDSPEGSFTLRNALFETASGGARLANSLLAYDKTPARPFLMDQVTFAGSQIPQRVWATLPARAVVTGGFEWRDCVVVSDQDEPWLQVQAVPDSRVTELTGRVTVINPHGARIDQSFGDTEVDVDVTELLQPPATTVRARLLPGRTAVRGGTATMVVTRSSADLRAPLAVTYSATGSAEERIDYGVLSGMAVIPAGEASVEVTIRLLDVIARNRPVRLDLSIEDSSRYRRGDQSSCTLMIHPTPR